MKIKGFKCKCGSTEFFFIEKDKKGDTEKLTGIYCMECGRWFKWADRNERNLMYLYKELNK